MNIHSMIHFYGTSDLEKTSQFYVDLLGLSLVKDQGLCHIYSLNNVAMIGFCSHLRITKSERSPIITFVVDDVKAWHRSLFAKGLNPSPVNVNEKFKIEHFFFEDPNGYAVEIQRFL